MEFEIHVYVARDFVQISWHVYKSACCKAVDFPWPQSWCVTDIKSPFFPGLHKISFGGCMKEGSFQRLVLSSGFVSSARGSLLIGLWKGFVLIVLMMMLVEISVMTVGN